MRMGQCSGIFTVLPKPISLPVLDNYLSNSQFCQSQSPFTGLSVDVFETRASAKREGGSIKLGGCHLENSLSAKNCRDGRAL